MKILGIETSCDETSAAIIQAEKNDKKVILLSNVVATSLSLHAKTGGIIPEIAARQQIYYILPVIQQTLKDATCNFQDIDAIAVTYGPGLIGSLLVGVETAKTLSYVWNKPLVPVNHLFGHIYANFIRSEGDTNIVFPALALIVSGGHTDLVLMKNHGKIQWLGGTRDDAAGEAFDKIGRLLDLPYPGGPEIEKMAKFGSSKAYNFPRPLMGSNDFDFSFSGLKTAVFREIQQTKNLDKQTITNICASVQEAIIKTLITKTLKAAQKYNVKSILISGGVAANQTLRERFTEIIKKTGLSAIFSAPPKNLCTDNGAMIASAGFFNYKKLSWQKLTADPELYFD